MALDKTFCPHFLSGNCNSCNFLDRPLIQSHNDKLQIVREILKFDVQFFVPHSQILGSRTRVKYAIGEVNGLPRLAIAQAPLQYSIVAECPLHHPDLIALAMAIEAAAPNWKLSAYNLQTRRGEWKYLHLWISPQGEIMIKIVLRSREARERIIKGLQDDVSPLFAKLHVVALNYLPDHQARIEGDQEEIISSQSYLRFDLGHRFFYAGPRSFVQAHFPLAQDLYLQAQMWLEQLKPMTLWDLYCGPGSFSLLAAPPNCQVTGIEISSEASLLATLAAREQGRGELMTFNSCDAHIYLQSFSSVPNVILVNPPRRGLGEKTCRQLIAIKAPTLIYSSCNPETLANDINILSTYYQISQAQMFDLFPYTGHCEVLCMLTLKA